AFLSSGNGTGSAAGNNTMASRTVLASVLINSQEGDTVTIDRLYSQFLHRAPDAAGLSFFVAAFQENQQLSGSGTQNPGNGNHGSGSLITSDDPAQAAIVPAGLASNGNNSGQTPGLTVEQAMIAILSSPEYISLADRQYDRH